MGLYRLLKVYVSRVERAIGESDGTVALGLVKAAVGDARRFHSLMAMLDIGLLLARSP